MPQDLSTLHGVSVNLEGQVIAIRLPQNHLSSSKGLPDIFDQLPRLATFDVSGNTLLQGTKGGAFALSAPSPLNFVALLLHLGSVPLSLMKSQSLRQLHLVGTKLTEWPGMCTLTAHCSLRPAHALSPPTVCFLEAEECLSNSAALFPSLRMYGGEPCHRADVLAALALYTAAGGSRSVWLRLSRNEWDPTDPVVVGEETPSAVLETDNAIEIRGPLSFESHEDEEEEFGIETWPGVYVKSRRVVRFAPGGGSFAWGLDTFPAGVGAADALEVLDLQGVGLSCMRPLPDELVGLVNLKELKLHRNNLQGTLPTPLLLLPHLKEVHLDWKEHGGLKIATSREELLQTGRWPQWVAEALTGKLAFPEGSTSVAVSYHVEDGVITLLVPKQGLMQSVMSYDVKTDAELTFLPLLDPFSRMFLIVSAILLVTDMVTDVVVALEFANSGDYGWLAISITCLALYAMSAAWYTAAALGSSSLNTILSAVAAMLGLGGLTQVLQMLLLRPVTLSGRFNLTSPFKVTRYLATLHFMEATFESLPQLVLQLYVRTVQGYGTVAWWGWLSLGVSFLSVLRIVIMQDRQVQLAEGHDLSMEGAWARSGLHDAKAPGSKKPRLNPGASFKGSRKDLGVQITSNPTRKQAALPAAEGRFGDTPKVPSMSLVGAVMLVIRVFEIAIATCGTVMIGILWRGFAFLVPGLWLLLFSCLLTLILSCYMNSARTDQVVPAEAIEGVIRQMPSSQRPLNRDDEGPEWLASSRRKRRSLGSLFCTSLSQAILCWFFTTAPLMLFPRFLPHAGFLVWRSSHVPLAVTSLFIAARYIFFLVVAAMHFDTSDVIIMIVVLCTPLAIISTLVITVIDLNSRCRRTCLLSGLWCDYDFIVNGKGTRGLSNEVSTQKRRKRRRKCCASRRKHRNSETKS